MAHNAAPLHGEGPDQPRGREKTYMIKQAFSLIVKISDSPEIHKSV